LAPHSSFRVMKLCFVPIISPSKKVVKVGWSSVKPKEGRIQPRSEQLYTVIWLIAAGKWLTLDAQVAAKVRFCNVHMFDFHINIVNLFVGHLSTSKSASGAKKRRSMVWQKL
jgi:uncharacterized membrane protein YccF (DUF307 family)